MPFTAWVVLPILSGGEESDGQRAILGTTAYTGRFRPPRRVIHRTLLALGNHGGWTYFAFTAGTTIRLATIGLDPPLDHLYEGVTLDPDPTAERDQ